MALVRLKEFEAEWGKRYPAIGQAWRRAWEHVVPFFAFAPGVRKMIYTLHHGRRRGAAPLIAQDHQNPRQLSQRRCGAQAALPRHQERRHALAARDRMDRRHGSVRHSVRRAFSGNNAMTRTINITATAMIAWLVPSPSSPAPAAHRNAASRLDRSLRPSKVADRAADASCLTARCGQANWLTVPLTPHARCTETKTHLHRNPLHKTSDTPAGPSLEVALNSKSKCSRRA